MQSFIDDGGEIIYINSGSQTSVQKKQKHYILYVLYTLVSIVFDCTTLKPFYGARALEHLVLTRFRTQQKRSAQEEAIRGRGLNVPGQSKSAIIARSLPVVQSQLALFKRAHPVL